MTPSLAVQVSAGALSTDAGETSASLGTSAISVSPDKTKSQDPAKRLGRNTGRGPVIPLDVREVRTPAKTFRRNTGRGPGIPLNDVAKLTEMVIYVASRLRDDKGGGATKLNKVLYFADFAHVRRVGRPISGSEYQKLEHGPAPRRLNPLRQFLVDSGDVELVKEDFLGYEVHRLIPLRDADLSVFGSDEIETINKVLADLEGLTGRQVSDLSHEEPGWRLVNAGETIPYETALIARTQISTPTSRRLAAEVAERYGLALST